MPKNAYGNMIKMPTMKSSITYGLSPSGKTANEQRDLIFEAISVSFGISIPKYKIWVNYFIRF